MDLIWRIGEFLLVLSMVSLMLFYVANARENINDTQEYITKQNNSDAYANRYASLSSFDADSVGAVSVQEALTLVYTYSDDSTPVIVRGPDNKTHVFTSGKWPYTTAGKPLARPLDMSGVAVNKMYGSCNSSIDAFIVDTEPVPNYDTLYSYLKGDPSTTWSSLLSTGIVSTTPSCVTNIDLANPVKYYVDINPDGKGNLQTVLLTATN